VKSTLPVLVAGASFAGAAILGLVVGIVVATRVGQSLYVPAGLLVGAAIGGYSALRVVLRSLQ
jgi:hypothetical protein